jgi:3-oxoacyl-(acyl-carrier-protein) synthase
MEAAEATGKSVLRPGCSAAVEVEEAVQGGGSRKRVVYVAECRSAKNSPGDLHAAAERARAGAMDGSGISPDVVVLIKPRTLPKTTSGKVRRSGVKKAFMEGTLQTLYQNDWAGGGGGHADVSTAEEAMVEGDADDLSTASVRDGAPEGQTGSPDSASQRDSDDEGVDDWARMQEVGPDSERADPEPSIGSSAQWDSPTCEAAAEDGGSDANGSTTRTEVQLPSLEEIAAIVKAEVIGAMHSHTGEAAKSANIDGGANVDATATAAAAPGIVAAATAPTAVPPGLLDMGPHTNLASVGLNSQTMVDVASRLSGCFDLELPLTAVLDYPTLGQLSEYVQEQLERKLLGVEDEEEEEEEEEEDEDEEEEDAACEEATGLVRRATRVGRGAAAAAVTVMVMGCSSVTPTPRSRRGVSAASDRPPSGDSVSGVPLERWHTELCRDDFFEDFEASVQVMTSFGGFMENMDLFDAALFGLPRVEAAVMDPQHRSLLEGMVHARATILLATRGADPLDAPGCGVYVGISSTDYIQDHVVPCFKDLNPFVLQGNVLSVAAGRLSFVFGLKGPSLSVDAACSSSIVSAHMSRTAIASGAIGAAAACGVQFIAAFRVSSLFNIAGMLAPDGRCKTLDAAANGYVRGEARGVLVLEGLGSSGAPRGGGGPSPGGGPGGGSGVAVIGTAVNQDGRSSSLTAPNGPSQQAVIRQSLHGTAVTPAEVAVLQMQGTGTGLGDPIEVGAAAAVFRRAPAGEDGGAPLVLEAIKTLVGHAETAAGVTALAQPLEGLVRMSTAAIMHLVALNPYIQGVIHSADTAVGGGGAGMRMPRQGAAQVSAGPAGGGGGGSGTAGGTSGFGFQGTNGHAVMQAVAAEPRGGAHRGVAGARSSLTVTDRQRFWVVPETHALLTSVNASPPDRCVAQAVLGARRDCDMWDHRVMNRALFPGAGFMVWIQAPSLDGSRASPCWLTGGQDQSLVPP